MLLLLLLRGPKDSRKRYWSNGVQIFKKLVLDQTFLDTIHAQKVILQQFKKSTTLFWPKTLIISKICLMFEISDCMLPPGVIISRVQVAHYKESSQIQTPQI